MFVRGHACRPGRKEEKWAEERLDSAAVSPWEPGVAFGVMLSWGRRVRLPRF